MIGLLVFGWTVAGKRGRILRLVRADQLAANVLGVRTFRTKLLVYVIAAFFSALAGALLFPFSGLVTPDAAGAVQSVQLVALIVVGGVGYRLGGFVGALVILWLQALVDTSGNWSLLIYAVVFLLVAFYAPGGIIGALRDGWRSLAGVRTRRPGGVADPAAQAAPADGGTASHGAPGRGSQPRGRERPGPWRWRRGRGRAGGPGRARRRQELRRRGGGAGRLPGRPAGDDHRADRLQRRGQEHAGEPDLRDRPARRRARCCSTAVT